MLAFLEVTCLQLVSLDISCNRIATLPVELRLMTSLVNLELENNPLTSPPASVNLIKLFLEISFINQFHFSCVVVRAWFGTCF